MDEMAITGSKISILQAFYLIIFTTGILNHVMLIPLILDAARRDAWVSTLLALAFVLLWLTMVSYVMRHTRQHNIMDWLRDHLGNVAVWIVKATMAVYFFCGSVDCY